MRNPWVFLRVRWPQILLTIAVVLIGLYLLVALVEVYS